MLRGLLEALLVRPHRVPVYRIAGRSRYRVHIVVLSPVTG
jgi:hypothetical protein